mgnify:FL=1
MKKFNLQKTLNILGRIKWENFLFLVNIIVILLNANEYITFNNGISFNWVAILWVMGAIIMRDRVKNFRLDPKKHVIDTK